MKTKPPCYKCEHRTPECHGKCDAYQTWAAAARAENEAIREKKIATIKAYPNGVISKTEKKRIIEV